MTVKHASVFLKRIQGFKDKQWEDIYKTALESHEHVKQVVSVECISGEDGPDTSEDDDKLLDPLYDDIPENN